MSAQTRRGLLVVLSGPSGVGKDVAIQRLKEQGFAIHYVVTATTRAPRDGEVHGVNYYFLSRQEFERMIERDELLEWSWVHENLYGPPIAPVRQMLDEGQDVLLKIDVQGAAKVRARSEDGIFIFLAPPTIDDLKTRMGRRHTETAEQLQLRIANASKELAATSNYDYMVVNRDGQLDQAVAEIRSIITAERLRVHPRHAQIH